MIGAKEHQRIADPGPRRPGCTDSAFQRGVFLAGRQTLVGSADGSHNITLATQNTKHRQLVRKQALA